MRIWDARKDKKEKALLLFAITGSKQFCGIAEKEGVRTKYSSTIPVFGLAREGGRWNRCWCCLLSADRAISHWAVRWRRKCAEVHER